MNATALCRACGERPIADGRRYYCSERCKEKWIRDQHPELAAKWRARSRRWREKNRGAVGRLPWNLGQPAYVGRLPGGLCWIDICPEPQWPIALRNTRALHGVLSALFPKRHGTTSLLHGGTAPTNQLGHSRLSAWSLRPCREAPSGWAVYWSDPEALVLAGRAHQVSLFNEHRTLYLSDARTVASPRIRKRGRRLVRVDAVTPVVIQSEDRTTRRQVPEASHIASTLKLRLAPQLGLVVANDDLKLELVHRESQQEWVDMGGKYGRVPGFTGHLVLRCNAVAHWLLACAATLGLGGRVAFGFGCVHVEEVAE